MQLEDLKTFKTSDVHRASDRTSEEWFIIAVSFEKKGYPAQAEDFLVMAEIAELVENKGIVTCVHHCGRI